MLFERFSPRICVVGLGYVGLPVAHSFAKQFDVVGFDVDQRRIDQLSLNIDWTGEVSKDELADSKLTFSSNPAVISDSNFIVVAVPTPVSEHKTPDFSLLKRACSTIGAVLKPGSIIIFESTVYPGATEEICGPALEEASGLQSGSDFKLAYSPERINPGDKEHPLEQIIKIVSGEDEATLRIVSETYGAIITAGIFEATSIKVAEAAKVLENTQRDINIALMNEMSKICNRLDIRSADVLKAAGTKWNFLPFTPGLVGGHCIGVDPYYLTSKAEQLGYHPEVILAGRRINDAMPEYVGIQILQMLAGAGKSIRRARVGVLGITFKENVPDIRNSKVAALISELAKYNISVKVSDPWADAAETMQEYGVKLVDQAMLTELDLLIIAVPHEKYMSDIVESIPMMMAGDGIVVDLKSAIEPSDLKGSYRYWSL